MALNKKDKAALLQTLMDNARRQGLNPDDHPSVERRIEREWQNIIIQTELMMNNALGGSGVAKIGWRSKTLIAFVTATSLAGAVMATVSNRETAKLREEIWKSRGLNEYVGNAILTDPDVETTTTSEKLIMKFDTKYSEDGFPATIEIPHRIPPEAYERLKQE